MWNPSKFIDKWKFSMVLHVCRCSKFTSRTGSPEMAWILYPALHGKIRHTKSVKPESVAEAEKYEWCSVLNHDCYSELWRFHPPSLDDLPSECIQPAVSSGFTAWCVWCQLLLIILIMASSWTLIFLKTR